MTNSTLFAVAVTLLVATIMAMAAYGIKYNFPADIAALSSPAKFGNETPVRATKGDRLQVRPEIPNFAGV
jgi:hypothetical protein